ncbi:TetR/AcrR family transcriptional regulator [Halorubrum sp. CBA1229]|jgi:AcrR family transcriptional regulator|uniref:TetR/AcrR family transcriptional regulator n=1 Tax=Halorubrum sp. CBA1229 TaxID=1853699 RepID=UPI000F41A3D1|nr:TetR/AcrR family transcriptional regulator [Halorubrum sp. CBA1229]QKY18338.1 TetR/AcrR family transcriptional regulator [Halorubrum sp. CBA1229]
MHDPFAEPTDTRQAILGAAFRALCEHGYADLTISRIGEEFDKSPSLVYHHYDGKDELLVDLLGFLLDGFESSLSAGEFDLPPRERLDAYLSATIRPGSVDDEHAPDARFLTAIVELRAQAASDDAYRDHFDRSDRVFGRFLERSVREAAADLDADSADAGDVDTGGEAADRVTPAEVAATLQTLATGGMLRWATTGDRGWVDDTRRGGRRYLNTMLPRVDVEA